MPESPPAPPQPGRSPSDPLPVEAASQWAGELRQLAESLNDQHKIVLESAAEALHAWLERSHELYRFAHAMPSVRRLEDILNLLLACRTLSQANRVAVLLFEQPWEETQPEFATLAAVWQPDEKFYSHVGQRYPLRSPHPLADYTSRSEPLYVRDILTDPRIDDASREGLVELNSRSLLLFPLVALAEWYGMLNIHAREPNAWTDDDVAHLKALADQAALAIRVLDLYQDRERLEAASNEAERARIQALAVIAHELRLPLTSIRGFATSLLAEDVAWDADSQRDFLTIIDLEAQRLAEMIEGLLDFSQLEAGTLRIHPRRRRLPSIFLMAMPQLRSVTTRHDLHVEIPHSLPPVHADAKRIVQVLTNLVENAAKYSPQGKPIRVYAGRNGNEIEICIEDRGPGIPAEDRERLFEPFTRAEKSARPRRPTGAGLGLAICKGIVEAHGGRIWISDADAGGACICFTLPIDARQPRVRSLVIEPPPDKPS